MLDNRWIKMVIFLGSFLLAATPRFIDLNHPSFSYDELMDYSSSLDFYHSPNMLKPITLEGYRNGQLPWFSAWTFYKIIGNSEKVARLNSVIPSLLTIGFVFLIVRRISGFWWAVITMVFLGLAPFYISASRLAFTHGHLFHTIPTLAGLYFLLRFYDQINSVQGSNTDRLNIVAAGLCIGLGVGCDPMACFWVFSGFVALLCWSLSTSSIYNSIDRIAIYGLGCILGVIIASPMYFVSPVVGVMDMLAGVREADSWRGFLWLGSAVDRLPFYYYAVVGLTKLTPLVFLLIIATIFLYIIRFRAIHPFYRFLFLSLWPIVYMSIKPGKSPYYLISFVPVLFILLVDTLRYLFSTRVFKSRLYLKVFIILLIVIGQLGTIIWIHPDYLMLGVQYGDIFYGEFQGPAVSHGQWVGEAFEFIQNDSGGQSCRVYIFEDIATPQIKYYSRKHRNIKVIFGKPLTSSVKSLDAIKEKVYIVLNQDAKRLIAPYHQKSIERNKELVSFVENSKKYHVAKIFYSGSFPMLWVYEKDTNLKAEMGNENESANLGKKKIHKIVT